MIDRAGRLAKRTQAYKCLRPVSRPRHVRRSVNDVVATAAKRPAFFSALSENPPPVSARSPQRRTIKSHSAASPTCHPEWGMLTSRLDRCALLLASLFPFSWRRRALRYDKAERPGARVSPCELKSVVHGCS